MALIQILGELHEWGSQSINWLINDYNLSEMFKCVESTWSKSTAGVRFGPDRNLCKSSLWH